MNSRCKYANDMNRTLKEWCTNTNDVELNWRYIEGCTKEVTLGIKRNIKRQEWGNEKCLNMLKKKEKIKLDNNQ